MNNTFDMHIALDPEDFHNLLTVYEHYAMRSPNIKNLNMDQFFTRVVKMLLDKEVETVLNDSSAPVSNEQTSFRAEIATEENRPVANTSSHNDNYTDKSESEETEDDDAGYENDDDNETENDGDESDADEDPEAEYARNSIGGFDSLDENSETY